MKKMIFVVLLMVVLLTGCGIDRRTTITSFSPNCDGTITKTVTEKLNGETVSVEETLIENVEEESILVNEVIKGTWR